MNQIMTPSASAETMTAGQIVKGVANYEAMLKKHAPDFPAKVVQRVLGMSELAKRQFELFRDFVEAESKTIVRRATVNRTRSHREGFVATGRKLYLNESMVKTMPTASGDTEVIFVNLGRNVDCDKLDYELSKLGFELIVDPQGLAAINEDDSAFADDYPNGTQWKNEDGNYCYVIFGRWYGKRRVSVDQHGSAWDDSWWFPCRRKLAL